jgi:hypothetical protein
MKTREPTTASVIVKGTILAAAATATQVLRSAMPDGVFEMVNSACGLLVSWGVNRLTEQYGQIYDGQTTSLEELEINGHLAKLASIATQYVIEDELTDPKLGLLHDKRLLRTLKKKCDETWHSFPDAAALEGKAFVNLVTFQTTGEGTLVGFTKEFWVSFIQFALAGEKRNPPSSEDFDSNLAEILVAAFPKMFFETAKDAAEKNPVGFATVQLHLLGALLQTQDRTDKRIEDLTNLLKESIQTGKSKLKRRDLTRFTQAASSLQAAIEQLGPGLQGLKGSIGQSEERVIAALSGLSAAFASTHSDQLASANRHLAGVYVGFGVLAVALLAVFWAITGKNRRDQAVQAFRERDAEILQLPAHEQEEAILENRRNLATAFGIELDEVSSALAAQADAKLEDAEELRRRIRDAPYDQREWPKVFWMMIEAGDLAKSSNDFKRSTEAYARALDIAKEQQAEDGQSTAAMRLALSAAQQGDNSLSVRYWEQSDTHAKNSGDRALRVDALKGLLDQLTICGKYRQAKEKSEELIEVIDEPDGLGTLPAHALESIAGLLESLENFVGAEDVYERAIASHNSTCNQTNCLSPRWFLLGLSSVRYKQEDFTGAIDALNRAEGMADGDPTFRVSSALRRALILLGLNRSRNESASIKNERSEEALDLTKSAIGICRNELPDVPEMLVNSLEVRSSIYGELGDSAAQIDHLEQARSVIVAHRGEFSRKAASLNLAIAGLEREAGNVEEAMRHYHLAAIAALTMDPSDPMRSNILLTQLNFLSGQSKVAPVQAIMEPLQESLNQSVKPDPSGKWMLATYRGVFAALECDADKAIRSLQEATELAADVTEFPALILTRALHGLVVAVVKGDTEGVTQIQDAIRELEETKDLPSSIALQLSQQMRVHEAIALVAAGRGEDAIPFFESQLQEIRQSSEPDPMALAETLGNLASALFAAGKDAESQAKFIEMEGMLLNNSSPWSLRAAKNSVIYAQLLIESKKLSEALELLAMIEAQVESMAGTQTVLYAEVNFLRASAAAEAKMPDLARTEFNGGVKILRGIPGVWPGVLLNILVNYSDALEGGSFTVADLTELRDLAITTTKSDFPAGALDAQNLWRLSDTLMFHGLEAGVWPLIDRALEIDEELDSDGLAVARDQNLRSVLFSKEGDFKSAEEAARRGLLIVSKHPESAPSREEILNDLIRNYQDHLGVLGFDQGQIEVRIARLLRGEVTN